MVTEPVVVFRGIRPSTGLLWDVRRRAQGLSKFYRPITRCDVAIEQPEHHHRTGNRCRVRVELRVPGGAIVVSHGAPLGASIRPLDLARMPKPAELDAEQRKCAKAVREAFTIARRRLQDFARRQRGDVKRHASTSRARLHAFAAQSV